MIEYTREVIDLTQCFGLDAGRVKFGPGVTIAKILAGHPRIDAENAAESMRNVMGQLEQDRKERD